MKSYKELVKESMGKPSKVNESRDNTAYWNGSGIVIQIPYLFPGVKVKTTNEFEHADETPYKVAKKLNDAINKEVAEAEKRIQKLLNDAKSELDK